MSALRTSAWLVAAVAVACGADPVRPAEPRATPASDESGVPLVNEPPDSAVPASDGDAGTTTLDAAPDAAPDVLIEASALPPRPPPKLAGPCVKVPDPKWSVEIHSMGVSQDGDLLQGDQEWRIDRYATDLDGDGQDDWLVPVRAGKHQCPWEIRYRVYIMRGACGHALGEVGPGNIVGEVAFDASGFRRLTFESRGASHGKKAPGIPYLETRRTEHAVSKGRYRKVDEHVSGGDCHHCAASTCLRL